MNRYLKQLAAIGNQPADTEKQKLAKRFLIYMALLMSGGGIMWGAICLYLGLLLPASIPFGYVLLTAVNLCYFSVSKQFRAARFIQISLSLLLPFFFQWSIGGFVSSGAVMLWAMIALLGSLTFQDARLTLRWFWAYLLLTVVSGVIDSHLKTYAPPSSSTMVTLLFVINILAVSVIVFGLMNFFVRSRELAHEELQLKNKALAETQTQLIHAEKMASIGLLTASIAHEVNNPIGAINSAADVSTRCITNITEVLETCQTVDEIRNSRKLQRTLKVLQESNRVTLASSERITNIVNSLKSFARLDEAEFQLADIRSGISNTLALLRNQLEGKKIIVHKELSDIPLIQCYPGQLNQVIMSLIQNAVDAIEGKGEVWIKTWVDGDCVKISVKDNGKGIDEDVLPKIFDPFFTTKPVGSGQGLGLATAHQIVEMHKGSIDVQSERGKGTEFVLNLPIQLSADI